MRCAAVALAAAALLLAGCDAAPRGGSEAGANPAASAEPSAPGPGPALPQLTGRVVDGADLLDSEAEARLARASEALERRTGDELVVVTVASLEGRPIEDYTRDLGNHWRLGEDRDDGVILLVAPNERRTRIAVGFGLEPILTNRLAGTIIDEHLLPNFREQEWEQGIAAATDAIASILVANAGAPRRGRP